MGDEKCTPNLVGNPEDQRLLGRTRRRWEDHRDFYYLLDCLQPYGMTENYSRSHLICVACDGAAVVIGSKCEVINLMKEKFPSLILWQCANHRLELSLGDTMQSVIGIDKFKAFIGKLYVVYNSSPINARELNACANLLGIEILKIGPVLSTRWVASSFRSVSAV
jgi:hypothetical protein